MKEFENKLHTVLSGFLQQHDLIDKTFPQNADIEEKWVPLAESYMADGIREFSNYPMVSLGWMMYVGMAVAKFWDEDWNVFNNIDDLYLYMREKRGYDLMDEYIREMVLGLQGDDFNATEQLVQTCAECMYSMLHHENFEPGTEKAFRGYVACLHQLYLMGAAVQLYRMGYKMTKFN